MDHFARQIVTSRTRPGANFKGRANDGHRQDDAAADSHRVFLFVINNAS
jgi:hypothetical protein